MSIIRYYTTKSSLRHPQSYLLAMNDISGRSFDYSLSGTENFTQMGNKFFSGVIEDWVKRLRQTGPNPYLFDLPDGVRSSSSTEDVTKLSWTDLRMIARALATNIYIFVSSPGQPEGHWENYPGTHSGPSAPAIYLAFSVNDEGFGHLNLVRKVAPKSQ